MANTNYTQVYTPEGKWYATFYTRPFAEAWVKKQENADKWEITKRRPPKKVS